MSTTAHFLATHGLVVGGGVVAEVADGGEQLSGDLRRLLVVWPCRGEVDEDVGFSHLRQDQHPFRSVVDGDVEDIELLEMAGTDEGHRRVVALLKRAIGRSLGTQGVRFDREHQRYWLMANRDYETGEISERLHRYTTKTGRSLERPVVHHAHCSAPGRPRSLVRT